MYLSFLFAPASGWASAHGSYRNTLLTRGMVVRFL